MPASSLENGFVGSEYVKVYAGCASIHDVVARAVQLSTDPDEVDLAFSTFFLDRTARSGITAAAIGGKDQAGPTKAPLSVASKRAYPSEA